jgi:hypothetical protein
MIMNNFLTMQEIRNRHLDENDLLYELTELDIARGV